MNLEVSGNCSVAMFIFKINNKYIIQGANFYKNNNNILSYQKLVDDLVCTFIIDVLDISNMSVSVLVLKNYTYEIIFKLSLIVPTMIDNHIDKRVYPFDNKEKKEQKIFGDIVETTYIDNSYTFCSKNYNFELIM